MGQTHSILVADIGGTNTTLAVIRSDGRVHELAAREALLTADAPDISAVLTGFLERSRQLPGVGAISACCLAAAGPAESNRVELTNSRCVVDGTRVEAALGVRTLVINDFSAVSHALPLLDGPLARFRIALPHTDGHVPDPHGPVKAVLGAGTGLGVGFVHQMPDRTTVFGSEGGHVTFGPFDGETEELAHWMLGRVGMGAGAELFITGRGIANIYRFFAEKKAMPVQGYCAGVMARPDSEWPALISRGAADDLWCRRTMELFVKLYGHFAGSLGLVFLPFGGLYLAGGIVGRNLELFLNQGLFMRHFEPRYKPYLSEILWRVPVYAITDMSVALYGAAQAARNEFFPGEA